MKGSPSAGNALQEVIAFVDCQKMLSKWCECVREREYFCGRRVRFKTLPLFLFRAVVACWRIFLNLNLRMRNAKLRLFTSNQNWSKRFYFCL